jgi:hypothetical protein
MGKSLIELFIFYKIYLKFIELFFFIRINHKFVF